MCFLTDFLKTSVLCSTLKPHKNEDIFSEKSDKTCNLSEEDVLDEELTEDTVILDNFF